MTYRPYFGNRPSSSWNQGQYSTKVVLCERNYLSSWMTRLHCANYSYRSIVSRKNPDALCFRRRSNSLLTHFPKFRPKTNCTIFSLGLRFRVSSFKTRSAPVLSLTLSVFVLLFTVAYSSAVLLLERRFLVEVRRVAVERERERERSKGDFREKSWPLVEVR